MSSSRIGSVTWTQPNTSTRVHRPSWIGGMRPTAPVAPAPPVSTVMEGATIHLPSRPPSFGPPSGYGQANASMRPPQIQTTREVELESEVAQLQGEIARMKEELSSLRRTVLGECEPEIVKLALTIAARVVGHELTVDPKTIVPWIQEGLATLASKNPVVVVAADVVVGTSAGELATALKVKEVVVDPSLSAGSCEVRDGKSLVEVGANARLAAMADALGVDGDVLPSPVESSP